SDSINQGGFAVCRHGNGRDWWIVCHRNSKNDFVEFLFTPNGISSPRILAIGSVRNGFNPTTVFSSDGKMLATIGADHGVDVFDFDRCSGDLSNHRNVLIPHWQGFLSGAFSSLGNYLYITNIDSVFQIDMNQTNLSLSLIASWDSTYDPSGPPYAALFHTARLAPDNKIYISTGNTTRYLHVINFPDQAGAACDLNQHAIVLPTYNDNSFPYQINFTLPAAGGTICDTLGLPDSVLPFQSTDENSVFVFPNPFESRLYLKSKKSKGVKIDLINSFGEILDIQSHIINESIELQTESLPHGIYFLSIKNETNTQVVKLVK
ncbi:MAG TPA: T9SS type A sorting domain-containing protein, partial [Bacteroidia bacterium]|nr:T9SS type A sorting domain-containing protein [Bacteroidia bacterium]